MNLDVEKLKYDNDQLLMQLGWLLERVLVKNEKVELPGFPLSESDMINSLRELKRIASIQQSSRE